MTAEQELELARLLPQKAAQVVDTQRRLIKSKIELMKSSDYLISVTHDPEQRKKYEADRSAHEKQLQKDIEFMQVLFAAYNVSKELSAQIVSDLEALK